jgi:hypothetical protein
MGLNEDTVKKIKTFIRAGVHSIQEIENEAVYRSRVGSENLVP